MDEKIMQDAPPTVRSVKFYTVGCKVNQYETQLIREQFIDSGFKERDVSAADIYVINTCTVTARADSDSIGLIRRAKRENPKANIIVTGCLVESGADRIRGIAKNIVVARNKQRLLKCLVRKKGISYFKGHTRAFLKIQDGCDNFCAYCKVPLVRGRSRSKSLSDIVAEAEKLAENGFKEIVLSGICLGAYGKDLRPRQDLCDALRALEKINGLLRIRLSSIEAGDVTDELILMMAQSKKICRHLHIPVQSGDDRILRRMNRRYSSGNYLRLIKKIRKLIPEVSVTTDCIVGFPGETDANFQNTLELIKKIAPLKVHIFPYSKREGTYAAKYYGSNISAAVIKERALRLKNAAQHCSLAFRKQFLGKSLPALMEGRLKEDARFWEGYTDNYFRVLVKAHLNLKNRLISVKIKRINKDLCEANFLNRF